MILQIGMLLQKISNPYIVLQKEIDGNAFQIDPPSSSSKETDTSTAFSIHSLWPKQLETDELI